MVTSVIRYSTDKPEIGMEPEVQEATDALRQFMFKEVYANPIAKGEESKAKELLVRLFADEKNIRDAAEGHRKILDALKANDLEKSMAVVGEHLDITQGLLETLF